MYKANNKTSPLTNILSAYSILILINACASISMPQGGQKDTKPPIVLYTIPKQHSLEFQGKKVILSLDEELDITKLKDKIIITPYYNGEFELDKTSKKLIIKLQDSLKSNETYTFNFQDGLKDIHEGINIKKYKLMFSTGQHIDSISIFGNVEDAFSKTRMKNYLVGLYPISDTANPEKKKPKYLTYTDEFGVYTLSNIKPDKYEIYAFNDGNKNQLLEIKSEYVAYQIDTINPESITDSLTLESTRNDVLKPKFLNGKNDTEFKLIFNKGIYIYKIESVEKLYHGLSENKKEILIYKTYLCEDSLDIKVNVIDSSYNDTTFTTKIVRSAPKKFKTFKNNLLKTEPDANYQVYDSLPLKLTFEYPIVSARDSSIILTNDSISYKYLSLMKDFKSNTSNTEFTYTFKRKPKEYIQLHIKGNSFYTSIGDTNAAFNQKYKSQKPEKKTDEESTYATLNVKTDEENFVIQLLNDKKEIKETHKNLKRITYKNLKPGKYSIRILADNNYDNKWDTGNYRTKTLPERVVLYKNYLDIRANWDIEDVDIVF